ncbi:MAG TPA: NrsF family protein [Steroidobacter sp.]
MDAMHEEAAARLYQSVRASIAKTKAGRMRASRRIAIAVCFVSAASSLIVIAASQFVYGEWAAGVSVAVNSLMSIIAVGAVVLSLASTSTLAAVWRGRGGFGPPLLALAAIAILVTPVYALFTLLLAQHVYSSDVIVSSWGARCVVIAALVGTTVLAAFGWALHRAVPEAPVGRAAVLGACAGAWAGAAVFFFCPSADQTHITLGHVLPVAMLTLVGMLMLPKVLRP